MRLCFIEGIGCQASGVGAASAAAVELSYRFSFAICDRKFAVMQCSVFIRLSLSLLT